MRRCVVVTAVVLAFSAAAWAQARTARSFAHTVGTTATRVEPPDGEKSYRTIRCWQPGTTPVYLGGKDVTPRTGYPICTNLPGGAASAAAGAGPSCETDAITLHVSDLYAVVSQSPAAPTPGGAQSLSCLVVQ
jgi:hypothetical protein